MNETNELYRHLYETNETNIRKSIHGTNEIIKVLEHMSMQMKCAMAFVGKSQVKEVARILAEHSPEDHADVLHEMILFHHDTAQAHKNVLDAAEPLIRALGELNDFRCEVGDAAAAEEENPAA